MKEKFADILAVGGKANSLGRAADVVEAVLQDSTRLEELYMCMFDEDAWVRMRAADSFEKVCRVHPEWIVPYIDRIQTELAASTQASIQWHIAQVYRQVELTKKQTDNALQWLSSMLSNKDVDWIVASNTMDTLMHFVGEGSYSKAALLKLLNIQQNHKSNAVKKRATKYLNDLAI